MTVIAMTREMGTRGKDVAATVAAELGLEVIHHELVEQSIAQRMDLSESTVHRFLEGEASLWERWRIDPRRMSHYSAEELLTIAQKGNVLIRGWGAAQLLSDIAHVVCVRVCAPMQARVAEMQERLAMKEDAEAAQREIEKNDEAHDRAIRAMFNRDWREAADYAAVLNSARMGVEHATRVLIELTRLPAFRPTDTSRADLADKLTLARVRGAIDDSRIVALASGLDMSVERGVVHVRGIVMQNADVPTLVDLIGKVEGVTGVTEDIRLMPYTIGP